MNSNNIQPKNETEDLLLSINEKCEKLIEQTHRKAEETLEVKVTKPKETFRFNSPIQIKGDWFNGLTSLEVNNFFLKKQKKIIKSNFIQTFLTSFHLNC